jgi:hypothetical protein
MKRHMSNIPSIRMAAGLCLALGAGSSAFAADLPKGAVLHFSFDQAEAGGTIPDRSGQNNSGRVTGAKWTGSGKQGGGCDLSSTNGCIRVANSPSLSVKQATIAVWFKTGKNDANWRRILNKGSEGACTLSIGGDSKEGQATGGKLVIRINNRMGRASDNVVADGLWHHGAVTFDGKEVRLYVDGQPQKDPLFCPADAFPSSGDLTIGVNRSGPASQLAGQSFDGTIDDVAVFNRALSADEIKTMVAAVDPAPGKPKFTKQQVAGRLRQLKLLYEEGLLTDEFYNERVKECEAAQ